MLEWFQKMWAALTGWLQALWDGFVAYLSDLPILILDAFLSAIVAILALIPSPDFLTNGLQSLLGAIGPDVGYFLSASGFDAALAILGAGFLFRMTRKLLTLGQW